MLKSKTEISDIHFGQRLYQTWFISVNIITCTQLTSIIVAPSEDILVTILSYKIAAAHLKVNYSMLKLSF
jgi:hypothetical protein